MLKMLVAVDGSAHAGRAIGVVARLAPHPAGHFNRLVEQQVIALGGIKSLYSDSFFTRAEFDRAYGSDAYAALKARYDPQHRLLGLYDKCVSRR